MLQGYTHNSCRYTSIIHTPKHTYITIYLSLLLPYSPPGLPYCQASRHADRSSFAWYTFQWADLGIAAEGFEAPFPNPRSFPIFCLSIFSPGSYSGWNKKKAQDLNVKREKKKNAGNRETASKALRKDQCKWYLSKGNPKVTSNCPVIHPSHPESHLREIVEIPKAAHKLPKHTVAWETWDSMDQEKCNLSPWILHPSNTTPSRRDPLQLTILNDGSPTENLWHQTENLSNSISKLA